MPILNGSGLFSLRGASPLTACDSPLMLLNRRLPCLRNALFSLARDAAVDHTGVEDGEAAADGDDFEESPERERPLLPSMPEAVLSVPALGS